MFMALNNLNFIVGHELKYIDNLYYCNCYIIITSNICNHVIISKIHIHPVKSDIYLYIYILVFQFKHCSFFYYILDYKSQN